MTSKRVHRATQRTPEELAELRAEREYFQREQPSLEQLVASGQYAPPIPMGEYMELKRLMYLLRQERERQGLSLADIESRSGIDRSSLCRLEKNEEANPTFDTVWRIARALRKRVICSLQDEEPAEPPIPAHS
jgi:DNA-binding phage protein